MKNLLKQLKMFTILSLIIMIASCSKTDEPVDTTPVASSITLISGDNQTGTIESELTNPIQVLVKDQNGVAFAGAVVKFSVTERLIYSASEITYVTDTNVITNANGIASIESWLLGSTIGTQTLQATVFEADGVTPINEGTISITAMASDHPCYTGEDTNAFPITDNGTTYSNPITFSNDFIITDVNVLINITHSYPADLEIYLSSPDGLTIVPLSIRNQTGSGIDNDNYIDTVFDDEASISIVDGESPFTGNFKPEGNLSDFNGMSSKGDWKLIFNDNAILDVGTLENWAIQLCND